MFFVLLKLMIKLQKLPNTRCPQKVTVHSSQLDTILNNQLSTYLLAVFGKWEEPLPYYNDQAYPLKNMHVPQA